jgi:hypothetical protein
MLSAAVQLPSAVPTALLARVQQLLGPLLTVACNTLCLGSSIG